tara:strand:+ start:266 stop:886 length:621 start_codon:yes stop_codon:yes gene_type:complete
MSRARDIADVIGVKLTSPIVQTDSIKDDSGTRVLASDSGSAWSWGSGVPSGAVIECKMIQDTATSDTTAANTEYGIATSNLITLTVPNNFYAYMSAIGGNSYQYSGNVKASQNCIFYTTDGSTPAVSSGSLASGTNVLKGGSSLINSNDGTTTNPGSAAGVNQNTSGSEKTYKFKWGVYGNGAAGGSRWYADSNTGIIMMGIVAKN